MSPAPVIEAPELRALLEGPEAGQVKLLDSTFVLPGAARSAQDGFTAERIHGALFFDIEAISDHETDLPHMLPRPEAFAEVAQRLGISNGDTIIVYGQNGMVMGPARAWWMFRVFGHDNVRVLNGGLPAWKAAGLPVDAGPPPVSNPAPGRFRAAFRPSLVCNMDAVATLAAQGTAVILDAREAERFSGSAPEPRPGLRSGHIPGSLNLPCMSLVDDKTGTLKPIAAIESILEGLGVKKGQPAIATCGSGVTACMIALAFACCGREDVPVYDGAWSEWGRDDSGNKVATS